MFDLTTLHLQVDPLIRQALQEDINSEDVSTNCVMPCATLGCVDLICKEDGILCGLQVFERVFTLLDASVQTTFSSMMETEFMLVKKLGKSKGISAFFYLVKERL